MSTNDPSSGTSRVFAWPLELELEFRAARPTAGRLWSLTALLNETEGISLAVADVHGQANHVRLYLTVDAHDLYDAQDRACTLVHDRVRRAGLGPVVLVAARPAGRAQTGRRMG